jgi:hypothetical protein
MRTTPRIFVGLLLALVPVWSVAPNADAAVSTIQAPAPSEVDALGRNFFDASADGRLVLTGDWGDGSPTLLVNVATGVKTTLPSGMQKSLLTDDGARIYFVTFAGLVPADDNGDIDIYYYTVATAAFTLVTLTAAPAGWTFGFQDISGDGRYIGLYGTNGDFADSGSFIYDTQTATWRQPDQLFADFQLGAERQSNLVRLSSDGRYAAWVTFPLAGARSEVWVYDRSNNTAVRASQRFNGAALTDGSATDPEISSDGRHVVFRSDASNLVSGVSTVASRVYVRNLNTATTVLVSSAESADAPYEGPSIGLGGDAVLVIENVPSTVGGNSTNAPQPVMYRLAGATRSVLTDPAGASVPNGYTLQAAMFKNGEGALYATTVDNAGVVSPTDPVGGSAFRVLATTLRPPLPARLLDTRGSGKTDDGLFQAGGLRAAGTTLTLTVGGRRTIPIDAEAVVLNVTAVNSAKGGFVTAWPCGSERPNASTVNLIPGRAVPNLAVTKLGADGKVCLFANVDTDLIVDALSFFPSGSELFPIVPQRMLDTRDTGETIDDVSEATGLVAPGQVTVLQLGGRGNVPAGAKSVVLNITAVDPLGSGFIKAYPCDVAQVPNASMSNYEVGRTKASQTIVALSATGTVCLSSNRSTHLVADAAGYFDASSTYLALAPARLLETRTGASELTIDALFQGQGARLAGTTLALTVSGRGNVPPGDQTVVLSVAAVAAVGAGFVTVFSCGQERPSVSAVNMIAGGTTNNHVIVDTGVGGAVCLFVSSTTHLVVDVEGVLP